MTNGNSLSPAMLERPRAMRWWERFPWKRLLVVVGLMLAVLVGAIVTIYLARSG